MMTNTHRHSSHITSHDSTANDGYDPLMGLLLLFGEVNNHVIQAYIHTNIHELSDLLPGPDV